MTFSSLPRAAKGVIVSAACWFASLFVMGIWFNTLTQLAFYICLMAIVISALIPTFRLPWVNAFKQRYREANTRRQKLWIVFVIVMCLVGVLWIGLDWSALVALLFK